MTEDPSPVPSEVEGPVPSEACPEPAEAVEWLVPPAPQTFSLNSQEFYDIACPRRDRPWIRNGSLPREKRIDELKVIVEGEEGSRRVVRSEEVARRP